MQAAPWPSPVGGPTAGAIPGARPAARPVPRRRTVGFATMSPTAEPLGEGRKQWLGWGGGCGRWRERRPLRGYPDTTTTTHGTNPHPTPIPVKIRNLKNARDGTLCLLREGECVGMCSDSHPSNGVIFPSESWNLGRSSKEERRGSRENTERVASCCGFVENV